MQINSSSAYSVKVVGRISRILLLCLVPCIVGQAQEVKPVHAFRDRTNVALFSADALVRTMDWQSTRMRLSDSCRCYQENILPPAIADHSSRMLAYSLAMSGVVYGASYIAHKTHHHRIERLIPMLDIALTGKSVIGNYRLHSAPPPLEGPVRHNFSY